jgi:hypothetical protein
MSALSPLVIAFCFQWPFTWRNYCNNTALGLYVSEWLGLFSAHLQLYLWNWYWLFRSLFFSTTHYYPRFLQLQQQNNSFAVSNWLILGSHLLFMLSIDTILSCKHELLNVWHFTNSDRIRNCLHFKLCYVLIHQVCIQIKEFKQFFPLKYYIWRPIQMQLCQTWNYWQIVHV